jgi:hypothetical protein
VADYPMTGADAQRAVLEGSGLDVLVTHDEADFSLQILARPGTPSVAAAEGLLD